MALGCSVTNNRAGAYVGPVLHTDDRTYTLIIKIDTPFKNCSGFPIVSTIPQRIIKYLPADLHISARLIRFIGTAIFGGGWWNGELAVSIRVIHMYLIEGSRLSGWERWPSSTSSETWVDSREGVRIRSRSWRVQSPPLEIVHTVTPYYLHCRKMFGSDSRSGWYEVLIRGEKKERKSDAI